MKLHRFVAILVLVATAIFVFTGEFYSVGSASNEVDGAPETVAERQAEKEGENTQTLQAVSVAKVPTFDHTRSVRISGVTQADKKTDITARAGGVVSELNVNQGDVVKKGDVLLKLAPEGRDAALASAEQALEQAKISADGKKLLVEKGTLPSQQLDQAMSALRAAESQVEAAKAEMERLSVTAAFDGIIDVLKVEQGGSVQVGTPVATLISLDPIIGVGEVNESDLTIVKIGNEATLRLASGPVVKGKIRYISREGQATTRTYTVEVEVPNSDYSISAGMTSEIILIGEPISATPLPRSVVTLNDAGELGVRAVDDDNKVVFYSIDIVDDSTDALILGGIPNMTQIIIAGQNLVSEGEVVNPVDADQETVDRLIKETLSQIEVQ